MRHKKDQQMLENVYGNMSMGKPVIVTMDLTGPKIDALPEDDCCGCDNEEIYTLIDILDRMPQILASVEELPIAQELCDKLRQAADCVESCCGDQNMFTIGSYDTL